MPILSLIAATTMPDRVIGINNTLPWDIPNDLKYFRQMTLNKPIIMGRKTFESLGRPLPKRRNIIITRQQNYPAKGCEVYTNIESAIQACQSDEEVMVIGGAQIYTQTLPLADRLYLTLIELDIQGDAFFPSWNTDEWQEITRETHTDPCRFHFVTLERIQPGT